MNAKQQETNEAPHTLDTQDHAAKISTVNELLGIEPSKSKPAPPEKPAPKTDAEQSVSEKLAEAETPPDSSESEKTVTPPKDLKELAELTGLKVEDLYALQVPASDPDGESPTIGMLKDEAAQKVDLAGRELAFEERRVTFANEQAQARKELEIVLAALPPGAIKPDVLDRARRERQVLIEREAARLVDVVPEWRDDDRKASEMGLIGEHLTEYGFDKTHAEMITDHRMLRYMRDNLNRKRLVEKALSDAKSVTPIPKRRGIQPGKSRDAEQTVTPQSSQGDQLAAIDKLLSG